MTTSHGKAVAILAANPAFAAILSRALEQDGGYRVTSFSSVEMLTTFLRISPVDVVVLDTDLPGAPAIDIARGLRNHLKLATSAFEIVALTRAAAAFHKPLLAAGIDAVLEKPVTPQQLLSCIDGLTEVQRAVDLVVLRNLIGLAASETASAQARAIAGAHLEQLKQYLEGVRAASPAAQQAHIALALETMRQFRESPTDMKFQRPVEPPPGMPIGSMDAGLLDCDLF